MEEKREQDYEKNKKASPNIKIIFLMLIFSVSTSAQILDLDDISTETAINDIANANAIAFDNLSAKSQIQGVALVGGNLIGNSATFASRVKNAQGVDVLVVSSGNIERIIGVKSVYNMF